MTSSPNGHGSAPRVLLLGGTSEIGLAIVSALELPGHAEVLLAGRDEPRLARMAAALPYRARAVRYSYIGMAQVLAEPQRGGEGWPAWRFAIRWRPFAETQEQRADRYRLPAGACELSALDGSSPTRRQHGPPFRISP